MTASRQWTREELDREHPLPEGEEEGYEWTWQWRILDGVACAFGWYDDNDGISGEHQVWVDSRWKCLRSTCGDYEVPPPALVALAVILASQGLDSREAMADALQAHVDEDASRLADVGPEDRTTGLVLAARANAAAAIVAMLRRGRVEP
jgi:hypothetical protein